MPALARHIRTEVGHERRLAARFRTIFRSGKVMGRNDSGLVAILNLSDRGALIETDLPFAIGDRLGLELADGTEVDAAVVWRDGNRTGVHFAAAIDSLKLLKVLAEERWNSRRNAARFAVSKPVEVTSESGTATLALQDISLTGAKLLDDGRLKPGMSVQLRLSADVVAFGEVRWARGLSVGVEFRDKLARSVIRSISEFQKS